MQRGPPRLLSRRAFVLSNNSSSIRFFHRQHADIVPNDLAATLEAQRAANAAYLKREATRGNKYDNNGQQRPTTSRRRSGTRPIQFQVQAWKDKQQETSTARKATVKPDVSRKLRSSLGQYVPVSRGLVRDTRPALHWRCEGIEPQNSIEWLQRDINNFEAWSSLTSTEYAIRAAILNQISKLVNINTDDIAFHPQGSQVTGLAMPTSDLDIRMSIPSIHGDDQEVPNRVWHNVENQRKRKAKLGEVFRILKASPSFINTEMVSAKQPLVKTTHRHSDLAVQIVLTRSTLDSSSLIKGYLERFPKLRPLFFVVKAALEARDLTNPFRGGISSYPLLIMLATFSRLNPPPPAGKEDVSQTLIDFLNFTADFNTSVNCLMTEPLGIFKKRRALVIPSLATKKRLKQDALAYWQWELSKVNERSPYLLCLQDPNDLGSDLGKQSTRIMDVRATFRKMAKALQAFRTRALTGDQASVQGSDDPLRFILGDSVIRSVQDRRMLMLRWAEGTASRERAREHMELQQQRTKRKQKHKATNPKPEYMDSVDRAIIEDIRSQVLV